MKRMDFVISFVFLVFFSISHTRLYALSIKDCIKFNQEKFLVSKNGNEVRFGGPSTAGLCLVSVSGGYQVHYRSDIAKGDYKPDWSERIFQIQSESSMINGLKTVSHLSTSGFGSPPCESCKQAIHGDEKGAIELMLKTEFWPSRNHAPFQEAMAARLRWPNDKARCLANLDGHANQMYDNSSWGKIEEKATGGNSQKSRAFRAAFIYALAKRTYDNYRQLNSVLTPELATCIAFRENSMNLIPVNYNYTLCGDRSSTAIGYGQAVGTTLSEAVHYNASLFRSPRAQNFVKMTQGKSNHAISGEMSKDPVMQMELIYIIMGMKLKAFKGNLASSIKGYDAKSNQYYRYVEQCQRCLKSGKGASLCL